METITTDASIQCKEDVTDRDPAFSILHAKDANGVYAQLHVFSPSLIKKIEEDKTYRMVLRPNTRRGRTFYAVLGASERV